MAMASLFAKAIIMNNSQMEIIFKHFE